MIRGEIEARINLCDDYCNADMTWTFTARSRGEFLRDAGKLWDWFMNDPIPELEQIIKVQETEENETPEDG